MVAAAELSGDVGVGELGQLSHDVHGDLPGVHQRPPPALSAQVLDVVPVLGAGGLQDQLRRDDPRPVVPQRVGQHLLGERQRELDPVEAAERRHPDQCAVELTDVVRDVRGDELHDVGGDRRGHLLGLLAEDGEPGLEIGGLDVGDQAHLEAAAQPVLERRDGVRGAVGRQHDLPVRFVQGVEGVEELLLQSFLALHELDVIDEQDVDLAVAPLELGRGVRPDGVDELVHERLGREVAHLVVRVVLRHVVRDRLEQMGLAEPGIAVDEQGVVRARPASLPPRARLHARSGWRRRSRRRRRCNGR